jgi:endonuclease/exonuclease/phosphatase family metal-dependent hydrolase
MGNKKNIDQARQKPSLSRKTFLKHSAVALLGLSTISIKGLGYSKKQAGRIGQGVPDNGERLRTIEYNVFNGCIGYKGINGHDLPEGENSNLVKTARDMGQISKRIMMQLALYDPNIITFCEGPGEEVLAEMAGMLKMNYAFFPGGKDGKGHFPGGILTHYEIIGYENRPFVNKSNHNPQELFTRHWGKAKLRLPNGEGLTVHSAHLWPFNKVDNDRKIRLEEIGEMLSSIHDDLDHDTKSVLLQGDLNHEPGTPEYAKLKEGGLIDMFTAVGRGDGYTHSSIKPVKRIDFIYGIGAIAKQMKACYPLFEGDFRMNIDDPKGFSLSDHIPVLGDFAMSQ